jgi:hypothetical protein
MAQKDIQPLDDLIRRGMLQAACSLMGLLPGHLQMLHQEDFPQAKGNRLPFFSQAENVHQIHLDAFS